MTSLFLRRHIAAPAIWLKVHLVACVKGCNFTPHFTQMAFKKINKEFVLSDSSVNVYGFRLLTSGYVMDEFVKNPIGYYMHTPDDGVLMRWEDIRLDGDRIIGKPSINMLHPRGDRTATEIEEGFLNAASMGKICVLEYTLEDNPDDAENPVLVATRWYNKECSIVDNPGNRNAMKLEDANGNDINLSDISNKSKIKKNNDGQIRIYCE